MGAVAKEEKNDKKMKQQLAKSLETQEFIDVNELSFAVTNAGKIGFDMDTGSGGGYYPKGQKHNYVMYCSGLYLFGKHGDEVRSAAVQHVTEFQPGYILPSGAAADKTDPLYNIAKYNKGDTPDPALVALGCPEEVMGDQMLWCVYNDLGPEHSACFELPPIGVEVQQTVLGL